MADAQIKITADVEQAKRALGDLTKALAGITAVAAGITYALSTVAKTVDDVYKASLSFKTSVAELNALKRSAELAGIGFDELSLGIKKLGQNIGSALVEGTGPAFDALKRLNLSARELSQLPADQQLKKVSAALKEVENPAVRAALAVDLLGKQGVKLLKAANDADELKKRFDELGLSLSDIDAGGVEKANDAITKLGQYVEGVLEKALAKIAPYILEIADRIENAITAAGGFDAVWNSVMSTIKDVVNVVLILVGILTVRALATGAIALASAMAQAGTAAAIFNTIVKKNPLMLAVGAALVLAKILGLDIVGAMDSYLGLSAGAEEQTAKVAQEVTKIKDEQKAANTEVEGFNKAQQKAYDALQESIASMENAVALERTRNTLGEMEYEIQKAIATEKQKLEKVGLSLNSQDEARIRAAQNQLFNEKLITKEKEAQVKAVSDLIGPQSAIGKEVAKLRDLQRRSEGKPGLEAGREAFARANPQEAAKMAIDQQKFEISNAIDLELGKYDQFLQLRQDYLKKQTELNAIESASKAGLITLDLEQQRGLAEAKLQIEKDRIAAETQLEVDKITKVFNEQSKAIENKKLLDLQAQQNSQFGFETQKQMAGEAAKFEMKSTMEKTQFALDQGAAIFSSLGQQNKKAFEAAKAFNIANAIMNTYMGATKAMATYPWPFGMIAAAAAVAAGMAQVNAIRSQQYSGRALGGPVMGNTPYIVGENGPELFTPNTTGSITRNGDLGGGGTTNVNFTIVANDTAGFDQLLTQRRGVITQIIRDAQMERGMKA
jgi:hypothetical protein